MAEDWPKIKARRTTRGVAVDGDHRARGRVRAGRRAELYHAVGQQDYIAIVAALPDGRIPIVRQYRPALESFTWELPAGLVDGGEDAATCCKRELMEETGFPPAPCMRSAAYAPCTARLSNRVHSFFAMNSITEGKGAEPGIEAQAGQPSAIGRADPCRRIRAAAAHWGHPTRRLRGYLDLGAFQIIRKHV